MKINIKSQKGIIASDALLAVILIVLFSTLILAISFNIFMSNSSLKRMSKATDFITSVFEHVDKLYYDEVTQNNLVTYAQGLQANGINVNPEENTWNGKGYKIDISVQGYEPENAVGETPDLVKEINMSVTYKLGSKEQVISMTRIKKRENLKSPNAPDFSLITWKGESENIYPMKKVNDIWKVTSENDSEWYNYDTDIWAVVIITDDTLNIGETVDLNDYPNSVYVWIPRYAYIYTEEEKDYKFLYQTTNNYVAVTEQGYTTLAPIDTTKYVLDPIDRVMGTWVGKDIANYTFLGLFTQMKNI